jgi:hypothetical protein
MTSNEKPIEPDATESEPEPTDAADATDGATVGAVGDEPMPEGPAAGEVAGIDAIKVDETELLAEIERLREENEKLVAARTSDSHIGRSVATVILIVIGSILFGLAISAVWLNRTIMNEDRWVATVAPLAQDVAIQDYVATKASEAIITGVDIQGYVDQALAKLPPQAAILSSPITGAIDNLIRDSATKIVRSEQFYTLWVQMNRVLHKAFIAAISDKSSGVIQKQGGTITLETTVLVDQIKQRLSAAGLGFVNNISIPIKNRQIVLVESDALVQLGGAVRVMNRMAFLLPFLALAMLAGGVALAIDRRKAVLWVGIGITASVLLPLEAIYFAQAPFVATVYQLGGMPEPAAIAAYTIVFRNLVAAQQLFTVVGLVFVVGAILAGPNRFATSLRNGFKHGMASIGPDWDFGPAGEWIYVHQSGMRTAGIIGAIVMLLIAPVKSYSTIVWLVVFVVVWMALVALFGRPRPTKAALEDGDSAESAAG